MAIPNFFAIAKIHFLMGKNNSQKNGDRGEYCLTKILHLHKSAVMSYPIYWNYFFMVVSDFLIISANI